MVTATDPRFADSRFYSKAGAKPIQIVEKQEQQAAARSRRELDEPTWDDQDAVLARCVESAVMKGLFGTDMNRRNFLRAVGTSTALAAISQFIPLDKVKAAIVDAKGPLEKSKAERRFRADHLRDADHHGPPDGLL